MASKKKQKGMVFHQKGSVAPAAALGASHPPECCVSKPPKARKGGMEQISNATNDEAGMLGKHNVYPSIEASRTSGGHPTGPITQSDNLPPDSNCKGIRVTLDNNSMWNEFFRCKTEMILTKQGSRMFPYCRFRISGLIPSREYSLIMDIQPLDSSRYKWTGKSWQVAGKALCHVKIQPFAHPESPSTGQHWMQNPVSFYKLKLTDNISNQDENAILHPMHRYLPRLHVVQTDKAAKDIKLSGPGVVTFTFPQTEFMAVTTYQNSRFAQLKVNYNPFAKGLKEDGSSSWGLKLKVNSVKDSPKDGGSATNEQHPVKKNLKSLLANHKLRSSKAVDLKPSVSDDLQKTSIPSKHHFSAKVPRESLCSNSGPAQKLFSELIREAHVSLQRCNVEQLGINNCTAHRSEQTNTKAVALNSNRQDKKETMSVKTQSDISPANSDRTKSKVKEDKHLLNSLNCKDNFKKECSNVINVAASSLSQNVSVDSDQKCKSEIQSDGNLKQYKRPAPLPLPALALFLKQHSTKYKKVMSKPDSPTSALFLSGSQNSVDVSPGRSSGLSSSATDFSKSHTVDVTKTDNQAAVCTGAEVYPTGKTLNFIEHADASAIQPCLLHTKAVATTDSNGRRTESPAVTERTLILPISDQPLCAPGLSTSTATPTFPPPLDTVLHAPKIPQTAVTTESSTLLSDSSTLFSDPECSSLGFEPLSPASSPEPLPSLPASLGFDLDSRLTPEAPENTEHNKSSAASVFKWHTVLPPPEPYVDTTFQPLSQPLPSIVPPFLPSHTPPHPEPQGLHTSTSLVNPAPSFQENEQSLPFPTELSPLALQLPLSPTFSSLDGDGLSPTPSLADLVHFFSTDDLGIGIEFANTEAEAAPCSPPTTVGASTHEASHRVQPNPANKTFKRKKSQRQKPVKLQTVQKNDDSSYTKMQPNLEEVEQQLFISFTSKEALRLHITDSEEPVLQTTPEDHQQSAANTPEKVDTAESVEKISAFEKILLRDLKLLKHRQVIHPVLQEVGLKMNLLDLTLAIDLQYLGVRLPIPPPGVSLESLNQNPPTSQGASAAFVSRTGKTTDMTQIKGWREKFTPLEAPSAPSSDKPEASPSSDLPKKNLSAFCSDMLDEYLENEGKLIDERAASFSQPQVEPVVYELPTRSTSYVRTLDSVLKKHPASSPTSDLISGFIPPSKRPKLSLKERKTFRKGERKPKGPKRNKLALERGADPVSTSEQIPALLNMLTVQTLAVAQPSELTTPIAKGQKSRKKTVRFNHMEPLTLSSKTPALNKRRKLKLKSLSQTLSTFRSQPPSMVASEDLAPLESDSELGASNRGEEPCRKDRGPLITRSLLRQKDLENGVVWEGRPRTCITEERASIALTSLFTLMGFVSENPTAPIQLVRRQAPPCLNDFCRLGCVCSSLTTRSKISHCGRPQCMFGCSCLKQKVVLLKNLDGSDSSPSHHQNNKRRKRRMKMAYILKEAESVSQPAERVRTLWKEGRGCSDPDPIHAPKPSCLPEHRQKDGSCARVRGYTEKKTIQKRAAREVTKDVKSKVAGLKSLKRRIPKPKKTKTKPSIPPSAAEPVQPATSEQPQRPPSEPPPKTLKRLIILAECKWESDADRNHVLKTLCEAMAQDRLDDPFWIKKYLVSPLTQTVEKNGKDSCIQYKVHISTPKLEREKPPAPPKQTQERDMKPQEGGVKQQQETQEGETKSRLQGQEESTNLQQDHLRQVAVEAGPLEDWQQEVSGDEEEAEPLEDWQWKGEKGDMKDKASKRVEVDNLKDRDEEKMRTEKMGLPFLTGISPAGFLSANRKKLGGTDHLVQVNGKLYPLAKIQLGKMGALHPANRLAAYLTGRVGSSKNKQGSSSSTLCKTSQSSVLTPPITTSGSSVEFTPPSPTSNTPPRPQPSVHSISKPCTDSQVNTSVVPHVSPSASPAAAKDSQVLMFEVHSSGKVPVSGAVTRPTAPPTPSQRIVLQPVQTAPSVKCYRRPDGKLVRLVPVPQLMSANPRLPLQRVLPPPNLNSSLALPAAPLRTPASPVKQTLCLPTGTTASSTSTNSVSVPPPPAPPPSLQYTSGFLPQKGMCTFKILPASSNKEPIVITCPKVPLKAPTKVEQVPRTFVHIQPKSPVAPVNLISLKPSAGRGGAGLGVKTVTVSAAPVGPGGVSVPQKSASSQTCTTQTSADTALRYTTPEVTHPPPPPSDRSIPEPGLAYNPVDLDIICVEDGSKDVMNVGGLSSSETENSSDFDSDSDREKDTTKMTPRALHNALERKRRVQMKQLFEGLRKEVGLNYEKTSEISMLKKAVQVIEELRMTDRHLGKKKRRLTERRDEYISTIAPTTDRSHESSLDICRGLNKQRRRKNQADVDLIEVVDLLEETDEQTDNSSDEDTVSKTTDVITITDDEVQRVTVEMEDEVQCVTVETLEESSRFIAAQRKLARMRRRSSLTLKKTVDDPSNIDSYRAPSQVPNTSSSPDTLIEKACEEIKQRDMKSLDQQRDAYITELSQRSGKSEVLEKPQQLSSKEKRMETEERRQAAGQVPAPVGGGVSEPPPAVGGGSTTGDVTNRTMIIAFSDQQQPPQGPQNPVSVHTPVQQSEMVLQLTHPVLTPPAPVVRDKPRTMPNILSRSKNPAPPMSLVTNTVDGEAPSFQALVSAEVLSLVSVALPGQPVGALKPGATVLQTTPTPGVASVTLNLPSLTNQQIHLTSVPHLPAGKICSFSAPLTVTNLPATNFTDLLQLIQPATAQQLQLQPVQRHQHQQVPTAPSPTPSLVVSAGSDQNGHKNQLPSQSDLRPECPTSLPPSTCGSSSSLCLSLPAHGQFDVAVGGPAGAEQQQQNSRGGGKTKSLLNEITVLNKTPGKQSLEVDSVNPPQSPCVLQLDFDSDFAVTIETKEAGIAGHQKTSTNRNGKSGVLAPPPLLQMNIGGANVVAPARINEPAGKGDAAGGSTEEGLAWRPMPRLVPLGLKGNQIT